jgi:guanine deaminase
VTARLLRGRVLGFTAEPQGFDDTSSYVYFEDGAVLVSGGLIAAVGDYADVVHSAPEGIETVDHRPHLILPGFIDPHLHFVQMQVVGSYAANLLEWLNTYTFVEEQKFVDPAHGERIASAFFDTLIRHGTTTAAAYCSVHPASADAFFSEAAKRDMLMIAG